MVTVVCLIADRLPHAQRGRRLRQRGRAPVLADSAVLTLLVVGEYLGLDQDQAIYCDFRRYYGAWFPGLLRVHRTTFTRPAAKRWVALEWLREDRIATAASYDPGLGYGDSVPVPVCRLARAYRCRRFASIAGYGYDGMSKPVYYGLCWHLRVCWPGLILTASLAAADVHDLRVLEAELCAAPPGRLLADRRYWRPVVGEDVLRAGLVLIARPPQHRRDAPLWTGAMTQARRQSETVASQRVGRCQLRRIWARDPWHLTARMTARMLRTLLSHTLCFVLCQQRGLPPLRFAALVID
jgi:hypothetical protein